MFYSVAPAYFKIRTFNETLTIEEIFKIDLNVTQHKRALIGLIIFVRGTR